MASFRRWVYIVLLGLVSAILLAPFLDHIVALRDYVLPRGKPEYDLVLLAFYVVITIAGTAYVAHAGCLRLGWQGASRFPTAIRYPSVIWSVLIGFSLILSVLPVQFCGIEGPDTTLASYLYLAALLLVVYVLIRLPDLLVYLQSLLEPTPKVVSSSSSASIKQAFRSLSPPEIVKHLTENIKELDGWIASESPVVSPDDDLINILPLVDRLTQSIATSPGNTIGLLGRFGSGKTSTINMVESRLEQSGKSNAIFIPVHCWGNDPKTLPAEVLRAGIKKLKQTTDTLALVGIPEKYRQAMGKTGPGWFKLLLLCDSSSPVDQLQRLDRVAEAMGSQIIFVIEDLDRNAHRQELLHMYTGLHRLLDDLKKCDHLSFVLAVGDTDFDFDRLCNLRALIPPLSDLHSGAILQAMRFHLLSSSEKNGIILPDWPALNIEAIKTRIPSISINSGYKLDYSALWPPVLGLLSTPRRLKTMLRHTEQNWAVLQGEVYLDELIAAETIRSCCPPVMDAIMTARLRRGFQSHKTREDSKAEYREWAKTIVKAAMQSADTVDHRHLELLACYFIGEEMFEGSMRMTIHGEQKLQTLHMREHNIYWERIWSGHTGDPDQASDQQVLGAFKRWRTGIGTTKAMVEQLESGASFADTFERLAGVMPTTGDVFYLNSEEILALSDEANRRLSLEYTENAGFDSSYILECLFRLYDKKGKRGDPNLTKWVMNQVSIILPVSLRLAVDIPYFWANNRSGKVATEQVIEVRQHVLSETQRLWENDGRALYQSLSAASLHHVYTLANLVFAEYHDNAEGLKVSDWRWVVPILLNGLEDCPSLVAPASAALALHCQHSGVELEPGEKVNVSASVDHPKISELIPNADERIQFFALVVEAMKIADRSGWDDLTKAWAEEGIHNLNVWLKNGASQETGSEATGEET